MDELNIRLDQRRESRLARRTIMDDDGWDTPEEEVQANESIRTYNCCENDCSDGCGCNCNCNDGSDTNENCGCNCNDDTDPDDDCDCDCECHKPCEEDCHHDKCCREDCWLDHCDEDYCEEDNCEEENLHEECHHEDCCNEDCSQESCGCEEGNWGCNCDCSNHDHCEDDENCNCEEECCPNLQPNEHCRMVVYEKHKECIMRQVPCNQENGMYRRCTVTVKITKKY